MVVKINRSIITIDGLAASGKSTISALLAKRLSYAHLNSGSIYRAVALLVLRNKINPSDVKSGEITNLINRHLIELVMSESGASSVLVDKEDVSSQIYSPEVSETTSIISALSEVRAALLEPQRRAYPDWNMVAEGRDMGTVVFPDAQIKFFITVSVEVRMERRIKQLIESGVLTPDQDPKSLKEKIEIEIKERDKRDIERSISPTKAANDAILVDNSAQTLTEIIESMYDSVAKRGLPTSR